MMITDKHIKQLNCLREDAFDLPIAIELNVSGKFIIISGNNILYKDDYTHCASFIYGMIAMGKNK